MPHTYQTIPVPCKQVAWRRAGAVVESNGCDIPTEAGIRGKPTSSIDIKAIPITCDEQLLDRLDNNEEVKQVGRSAVIRHAVADYLRKKRRITIADAYRRAYKNHPTASDLSKWADEGVWPDE